MPAASGSTTVSLVPDGSALLMLGAAGRAYAVAHYGLQEQADKLAAALHEALTAREN